MWLELITLGYITGQFIYNRWFAPKPAKEKASTQLEFPRATLGDPVPLVYGTCRLRSPVIIDYLGMRAEPEPDADGVIRYLVNLRMLLARGNSLGGLTEEAELRGVYVADSRSRAYLGPGYWSDVDGCRSYYFDDQDMLGGPGQGGSVGGYLFFYTGTWEQTRQSQDYVAGEDLTRKPPYRGQVVVSLINWQIGESANLPPMSFVIFNPITIPGYEVSSGAIGDGDVNPAAVLRDILSNPWGGVGSASADIDDASFSAAAETLQNEQHGISISIGNAAEARQAVEQILRQIDGVLYEDPVTHQYVLKLIRDDYSIGSIPLFDESNVIDEPELSSSLYEETCNEVRVIWTNPALGYNDDTAAAQDGALLAAQGGRRSSAEYRMPGVSNSTLAAALAWRELNFLSRPIAKLKVGVNRDGFDLRPGDPIRFMWANWNSPTGYDGVFRVSDLDFGTLEDGKIVITAVQDRFAVTGEVFEPPDEIGPSNAAAVPIRVREITEAPRWIQLQAYNAGKITSADIQHSSSLAIPEDVDVTFRTRISVDGAASTSDANSQGFPGYATVDLAYSRAAEPYDTTTGLRIRGVVGTTIPAALSSQIALGSNLICVGSGESAEFMAYESATNLGGGDYLLNNVWRGLLDTAAVAHAEGEPVWFIGTSINSVGIASLTYGTTVEARAQASAGSSWTAESNSPYESFVVRQRTLLPYPAADLRLQGLTDVSLTKDPDDFEEEVLVLDWRSRNRTTPTIVRGDASDETTEAGTTFAIVVDKTGRDRVDIQTGITGTASTGPSLAKAGHGTLQVGIDARRAVSLPDGTTPTLGSWTVPKVDVVARHWRNLLRNCRFFSPIVSDTDFWTTTAGTPDVGTTGGLGGNGRYLMDAGTSGTGVNIYQDIDITGYDPVGLRATLDWYDTASVDSDDTVAVELTSHNAAGTELQSEEYAATAPSATEWRHRRISIDGLHEDTAFIRVRVILGCVGEIDLTSSARVTEMCLRVGQISDQLLSEPSFEGGTTGWTSSGGTWGATTPTQEYEGLYAYRCSSDDAVASAYQEVPIPAGYEGAGVAVLEFGFVSTASGGDTGQVILEARSSGGTVLATTTTGAITTTVDEWARQRLSLELPANHTATVIRVTLVGTRVTSPNINVAWDDFDLRIHKHLDPYYDPDYSFETPVKQGLPRTVEEWRYLFPDVTPPDYAIFDGGTVGRLGSEPLLRAEDGIRTSATAVVRMPSADGSPNPTTTCYENLVRQNTGDLHTNSVGTSFGNFSTTGSFTALAFVKVNEHPFSAACGVMGRFADGVGWSLELDASGHPTARMVGNMDTASVSLTPNVAVTGGGLNGVAIAFDHSGDDLYVVSGAQSATTSTATIGDIYSTVPGRFRLFRSDDAQDAMPGQIVRAYIWRSFVPVADLQSLMTYATDPTGRIDANTRDGSIAVVTESNSTGLLVETFGPGQVAIALHESSERRYLVSAPSIVNVAPSTFEDADWTEKGTDTVEWNAAIDPTGYRQAAQITSVSGDGAQLAGLSLGTAGDVVVAWFAKGNTAHSALIRLEDASGVSKDARVYSVTTSWQLFTWVAAGWDGATSGVGRLLWSGVDTGSANTIFLSPIILVAKGSAWRGVIPMGTPSATVHSCDVGFFNASEGEIEVEAWNVDVDGTVFDLNNGTNSNDRRLVKWDAGGGGGDVVFDHYTGAGANTAATITDAGVDPSEPYVARARWSRAIVPDVATPTGYSIVRVEQGATVETADGRTATWTHSATEADLLRLGHDGSTGILSGGIFRFRLSNRPRKVTGS